jgi:hypothetical protein
VHGFATPRRAVTTPSSAPPRLEAMKRYLLEALQGIRHDRNVQDAAFCTLCWLGFASVVVASVALPA